MWDQRLPSVPSPRSRVVSTFPGQLWVGCGRTKGSDGVDVDAHSRPHLVLEQVPVFLSDGELSMAL